MADDTLWRDEWIAQLQREFRGTPSLFLEAADVPIDLPAALRIARDRLLWLQLLTPTTWSATLFLGWPGAAALPSRQDIMAAREALRQSIHHDGNSAHRDAWRVFVYQWLDREGVARTGPGVVWDALKVHWRHESDEGRAMGVELVRRLAPDEYSVWGVHGEMRPDYGS